MTAPRMLAGRRNTELGLIILVALITTGAYLLTSLAVDGGVPVSVGPFAAFVVVLLVVAHVAVRRLAPRAESVLLPTVALLNALGYVVITRLDPDLARLQSLWTAAGVAAFVGTLVVVRRARDLARYRWSLALAGISLLLLPLVPGLGRTVNGSRIWIQLGPVRFQPGEMAKIVLAVFLASYLLDKRELLTHATRRVGPLAVPEPRDLGPLLVAWAVSLVVIVFERDLGSSLLFFALFVILLWVATDRWRYLVTGAVLFATGAWVSWGLFDHVRVRVDAWLHPFADEFGSGFQLVQAMVSFAAGGLVGTGIGMGNPERIPAAATDMVLAVVGEELGLVGTTAVIAAYLVVVGAGLRIAARAGRGFEALLATGLTVLVGVQALIIMAGVTRMLPLTGVTLPFMSYGGSSLVTNYVLVALLLRLSDDTEERRLRRAAARAEVVR